MKRFNADKENIMGNSVQVLHFIEMKKSYEKHREETTRDENNTGDENNTDDENNTSYDDKLDEWKQFSNCW